MSGSEVKFFWAFDIELTVKKEITIYFPKSYIIHGFDLPVGLALSVILATEVILWTDELELHERSTLSSIDSLVSDFTGRN